MRQCHRLPVIIVVSKHEPLLEPFPIGDDNVVWDCVPLCIPVRESKLESHGYHELQRMRFLILVELSVAVAERVRHWDSLAVGFH